MKPLNIPDSPTYKRIVAAFEAREEARGAARDLPRRDTRLERLPGSDAARSAPPPWPRRASRADGLPSRP